MPMEPPRVCFWLALTINANAAGTVSATPIPCNERISNKPVKLVTIRKPSVANIMKTSPPMIKGLRCPIRSIKAPANGCSKALTNPKIEIKIPTRTVSGRGNKGAGSFATKRGRTIKRILFPIASPSRAAERAITTRFPPMRSSLSKFISGLPQFLNVQVS